MRIPNVNSLEFLSYDPYSIFNDHTIDDFFDKNSLSNQNIDTNKDRLTQTIAEEILSKAGGVLFVWSDIYREFREKKNHNLMKQLIRDQIINLKDNPNNIRKEIGRCYICASLIAFQNIHDTEKYGWFVRDCKSIVRSISLGSLWKASCESVEKEDRQFINYVTQSVMVLIANYRTMHDNRNINLIRPVIKEFEEWMYNTSNKTSSREFISEDRPYTLLGFENSNLKILLTTQYDETIKKIQGMDNICNQIIERVKPSKSMHKI